MLYTALVAFAVATSPEAHAPKGASMSLWAMHAKEGQQDALKTKNKVLAAADAAVDDKVLAMDVASGEYSVKAGSLKELMKKCDECHASMVKVEDEYKIATGLHTDADRIVRTKVLPATAAVTAAAELHDAKIVAEAAASLAFKESKAAIIHTLERGITNVEGFTPTSDATEFLAKMDKLKAAIDIQGLTEEAKKVTDAKAEVADAAVALKAAKAALAVAEKEYADAVAAAEAAEAKAVAADVVAKKACGMMKAMTAEMA